jgi:formate hydrogenlyase subunit 6/NADH:ubiquinone oxidoreductase subunit I
MTIVPMVKTILKSLTRPAVTLRYPFAPMPKDPSVRGQVAVGIDDCIFCGLCSRKCPTHAITTDKNEKIWEISRFQCIVCGACVEACPKKCLYMKPELPPASGERTCDKVTAGA